MVTLVDYESNNFLNEIKVVNKISYKLNEEIDEVCELKFSVLNQDGKINFSIFPSVDFISLTHKNDNLSVHVDVFSMPKKYLGELILDEEGIIKKIPVYFEKKNLIN